MRNRHASSVKRRWAFAVGCLIVLTIIYDTLPLGGNLRFYGKWIECGQKPLAANYEWSFQEVSYYGEPPSFSVMRLYPEYFCTPLEAEQAGYSASPDRYEFPNIQKQG